MAVFRSAKGLAAAAFLAGLCARNPAPAEEGLPLPPVGSVPAATRSLPPRQPLTTLGPAGMLPERDPSPPSPAPAPPAPAGAVAQRNPADPSSRAGVETSAGPTFSGT